MGWLQLRHYHGGAGAIAPITPAVPAGKSPNQPCAAQPEVTGKICPQFLEEGHGIVSAGGIARAAASNCATTRTSASTASSGCRAGLESPLGVTDHHALLLSVLMQQACGIQIQPCSLPCGWAAVPGASATADESNAGSPPLNRNPQRNARGLTGLAPA